MQFVVIGWDDLAEDFVLAALNAGWRCLAVTDIAAREPLAEIPGAARFDSLEAAASTQGADLLVVAGEIGGRADLVRSLLRLLPVDLVVSVPLADSADLYYELALVRNESRLRLLPLMPELGHPALERIRSLVSDPSAGPIRWIEWILPLDASREGALRFADGWSWLRAFEGEIVSLSATGSAEISSDAAEIVASLRFENEGAGRLGTIRWIADPEVEPLFRVETAKLRLECRLSEGFAGPATLRIAGTSGERSETIAPPPFGERMIGLWEKLSPEDAGPWTQATRQVELADAVERSLERERAVSLHYDEFTEAASFKSIMTTTGCGLLWFMLLVVILAAVGVPFVIYLVLPLLLAFLGMQLFGLALRGDKARSASADAPAAGR